jgi:hypothetical protein
MWQIVKQYPYHHLINQYHICLFLLCVCVFFQISFALAARLMTIGLMAIGLMIVGLMTIGLMIVGLMIIGLMIVGLIIIGLMTVELMTIRLMTVGKMTIGLYGYRTNDVIVGLMINAGFTYLWALGQTHQWAPKFIEMLACFSIQYIYYCNFLKYKYYIIS